MFLERDSELSQLLALLDGLTESGGRVVVIRGEAGIGKSALISAFLHEVADRAHIHVGRCDDLRTPQPLAPFWDVGRDEASIRNALEDGDSREVLQASLDLLDRELRPTVLVIEDAQWADEATLDAVRYLGRRIAHTNGLLVLAHRDAEVDGEHPLRVVMGDLAPSDLVRINLRPLTEDAVSIMIGDSSLEAPAVVALTGGNPLFVTEVVASDPDTALLSVTDSVLSRAARLSQGARRLLDVASVMPRAAPRQTLMEVAGASTADLDECRRQGLLDDDGHVVSFVHELARRAVEWSLSAAIRIELNAEVLETCIREGRDFATLSHHARESDDPSAIIEFAPRAAREALAIGSYREALHHLQAVEPLMGLLPSEERASLLEDLAVAAHHMYLHDPALDHLSMAISLYRELGDDLGVARSLTRSVRLLVEAGLPGQAEAHATEAVSILERTGPSTDLAWALSQHALAVALRGGAPDVVISIADRAIEIAKVVGDDRWLIDASTTRAFAFIRGGRAEGLAQWERCRRLAEEGGYHEEEVRALFNMAINASSFWDTDRAIELARRARVVAGQHNLIRWELGAMEVLGRALFESGRWEEAEGVVIDAAARKPSGTRGFTDCTLGLIQARQGRPEAMATIEDFWADAERSGLPQHLCDAGAAIAELMWLVKEPPIGLLPKALEGLASAHTLDFAYRKGEIALFLSKLGRLTSMPSGIAEPYRLMIDGDYLAAADFWEARQRPYEMALALMVGTPEEKLEALRIVENLGAEAPAGMLREQLRRDGVAVPRRKSAATRSNAAGLTARQLEVLHLLARGLSSPEIADSLFISRRTAESHVGAIIMKLRVDNRAAAVERAIELHLIEAH